MKKLITVLLFISNLSIAAPVEITTPAAAGGTLDIVARTISKILLNNDIDNIVVNRPGADGVIAYNYAATEKNNIMIFTGYGQIIKPSDLLENSTIIGPVSGNSVVVFATNPQGYKTFNDLIIAAQKNTIPCGISHPIGLIELKRLNKNYNTKFEPVTYKGSGPLSLDLASDVLTCAFDTAGTHIARHEAGHLKILASSEKIPVSVPLISSVLPKFAVKKRWWFHYIVIPNGSNLLNNKKLLNIINNLGQYSAEFQPLLDMTPGLAIEKPDTAIRQDLLRDLHKLQEVNFYQN